MSRSFVRCLLLVRVSNAGLPRFSLAEVRELRFRIRRGAGLVLCAGSTVLALWRRLASCWIAIRLQKSLLWVFSCSCQPTLVCTRGHLSEACTLRAFLEA